MAKSTDVEGDRAEAGTGARAQDPESVAQALIEAARRSGADSADALVVRGTAVSIGVREGALEVAEREEGTDVGLRVFAGKRVATVSGSETDADTIRSLAERAVAMAREAPEDEWAGLADPDQLARDLDPAALELDDPAPEPPVDALMAGALEAEAAGRAVKGVAQVEGAESSYSGTEIHLAATNGFSGGYRRTGRALSCSAIAGTGAGMESDYDSDYRAFGSDLREPAEIGRMAGERAVARLGARKPETGTFPVLFDERISGSLVGHLVAAANGTAVMRGATWLKDSLGAEVLPKGVSLTENPLRPRIPGSRPFDGEGLPTKVRDIVADGVLQGWILDLASARKLGLAPTGNASRGIATGPSPSVSNLALTQGDASRADLVRQMGTGLLATSLIGATINPNTGDYSRGASGFWVENGEIAYPVNECTIAGNLRDMLARIVPANDARPWLSVVVPSILMEGMTLAGE